MKQVATGKELAKQIYKELESKVEQIMTETSADFYTVCRVMNELTKDFTCEITKRYP